MSERTEAELVQDMLEAIRRISSYTHELTYDDFLSDTKTQDTVTRNLEIIGEAAKKTSEQFRNLNPDIPWRSMAALRDRLIHDYFGVNLDIVWEIISTELPPVGESLEKTVGEQR